MGTVSESRAGRRRRARSPEEILRLLAPTATTPERVAGLLSLGLHPSDLAEALGATPSTLRNWHSGDTEPRPNAAITLDDLRATARTLLDDGLETKRVAKWLMSRDRDFEGERPIDVVGRRPNLVLSAAYKFLLDESEER